MVNNKKWLDILNVDTFINGERILEGLTLKLYFSQNTVILGPNGSGKSTLIRLIDRSIYPVVKSDSHFRLLDTDHFGLKDIRQNIGFVSNEFISRIRTNTKGWQVVGSGFIGSNTVEEGNLSMKQISHIITLLNYFNLEELQQKEFFNISDGEKRLLLIARAMVNNPRILVLDEPTSNLDIRAKHQLLALLSKLSLKGLTLLHVTHNVDTIINEISNVVLLKNRKIFKVGSVHSILNSKNLSELYDTPVKLKRFQDTWYLLPNATRETKD